MTAGPAGSARAPGPFGRDEPFAARHIDPHGAGRSGPARGRRMAMPWWADPIDLTIAYGGGGLVLVALGLWIQMRLKKQGLR